VGRDSALGIASDSIGDGQSGDRIPVTVTFFAPVQADPSAYPASYTTSTDFLSQEAKRSERGVNHPHPSSSKAEERVELYLYSSVLSWEVVG
jgi:hypothetical protein